jgi:hypothetical protein
MQNAPVEKTRIPTDTKKATEYTFQRLFGVFVKLLTCKFKG